MTGTTMLSSFSALNGNHRASRSFFSRNASAWLAVAAVILMVAGGVITSDIRGQGTGSPSRTTSVPAAVVSPEAGAASPPAVVDATELRFTRLVLGRGEAWTFASIYSIELVRTTGTVSVIASGETRASPVGPNEDWGLADFTAIRDVTIQNELGDDVTVIVATIGLPGGGESDHGDAAAESAVAGQLPGPADYSYAAQFHRVFEVSEGDSEIGIDSGRDGQIVAIVIDGSVRLSATTGDSRLLAWGEASSGQVNEFDTTLMDLSSVAVVDGGASIAIAPAGGPASIYVWTYEPNSARAQERANFEGPADQLVPADPGNCTASALPAERAALIGSQPFEDLPNIDNSVFAAGETPVDAASAAELTALFASFVDCLATGDPNRYLALVSDGYLASRVTAEEIEAIRAAATVTPIAPSYVPSSIYGWVAGPDRVSAFDTTSNAFISFVREAGVWRIDLVDFTYQQRRSEQIDPRSDVGQCPVPPRDLDATIALLQGTPVPAFPIPALGAGEPASAEQIGIMNATLTGFAACLSQGTIDYQLAMYSDAALTRLPELSAAVLEEIEAAALDSQDVSEVGVYTVNQVWDVRVLPDGRLTAQVNFNDELALITIVNVDGTWLIDWFDDSLEIEPRAE